MELGHFLHCGSLTAYKAWLAGHEIHIVCEVFCIVHLGFFGLRCLPGLIFTVHFGSLQACYLFDLDVL